MTHQTILLELLLGGFFAVACIRTSVPVAADRRLEFGSIFRFPGRIERLRRSRWQWFSMVLVLLVFRLQNQLPLILEMMVALQFIVFLALPSMRENDPRKGTAAMKRVVANRVVPAGAASRAAFWRFFACASQAAAIPAEGGKRGMRLDRPLRR